MKPLHHFLLGQKSLLRAALPGNVSLLRRGIAHVVAAACLVLPMAPQATSVPALTVHVRPIWAGHA